MYILFCILALVKALSEWIFPLDVNRINLNFEVYPCNAKLRGEEKKIKLKRVRWLRSHEDDALKTPLKTLSGHDADERSPCRGFLMRLINVACPQLQLCVRTCVCVCAHSPTND